MKLYAITDEYINYLRKFDNRVYDNKEDKIKRYANILYKQKINNYDVSYIKSVVDFKLLEDKCLKYKKSKKL